jgi:hypothetical protein
MRAAPVVAVKRHHTAVEGEQVFQRVGGAIPLPGRHELVGLLLQVLREAHQQCGLVREMHV